MTSWGNVFIRRSVTSVVFVWALSAASASANAILSVTPATQTVYEGETFTVNIDIADVDDLFSYGFDLAFDPTILKFEFGVEGEFLQSGGVSFLAVEGSPGILTIFNSLAGPVPGVSGGGRLAIATFMAIMAGTSSLDISNELFADSTEPFGNPIAIDAFNGGEVQVNQVTAAVPDAPSTMILLVAALALAGCRSLTRA